MGEVTKETLQKAHKPFDIVSIENGSVGFIKEVSVNDCQDGFDDQISYSVCWMTGKNNRSAWFDHSELNFHGNIMIKISKAMCNGHGNSAESVDSLFGNF